jgi:hypothetical protein
MQSFKCFILSRVLLSACVVCALLPSPAVAQEVVVIACPGAEACVYQPGYAPTLMGQRSVRLFEATRPGSSGHKGRSVRLANLPGLYREPESGTLRVLHHGEPGAMVAPAKLPRPDLANAASGWTLEYRPQASSKTVASVSHEEFVALLRGPALEAAVIEFLKREVQASTPHPRRQSLVAGAVLFTARSDALRLWRQELSGVVRHSLEAYKHETVDPDRMEATLAEGMSALRVLEAIGSEAPEDNVPTQLSAEYERLLQRFSIAQALKTAGLHDAFLEKLNQIGLPRWSRPELVDGWERALEASATDHHQRAVRLLASGQHAAAFDAARLASHRAPCNEEINEFYYRARVEFVNRNLLPTLPEYDSENRTILQQIVRELQSMARDPALTPERVQYVRKRVSEGERLDTGYLPLQLKKAEFLATIGELTASRAVVTQVERSVRLARPDAEEWLNMDASLNANLVTLRQTTEKKVRDHIANGEFKEALDAAEVGLSADPDSQRFLYYSAVAAAVLRQHEKVRQFVQRYLRPIAADCGGDPDARATLLELVRRHAPATATPLAGAHAPNWMSGERYAPGEAFYDPVSGSLNSRMVSSVGAKGSHTTGSEFRWEGFLATSIVTFTGSSPGARRILLELEPVYNQPAVYMTGIGPRANSEGRRRVMPLRYLNSPEFDPLLAARFTDELSLRGWAGNPFFHPFLWNDIFLFDLVYDEFGRIKEAIPVAADASRPVSEFSERLAFTWEGSSKRLLAISGARYRREMFYDDRGRLVFERVTHPAGKGRIDYSYEGHSKEPIRITCEDNFYDRSRRNVLVESELAR